MLADDNELLTNAAELNNFHEVSQEDLKEFAYKPLSKSCYLDPLAASLPLHEKLDLLTFTHEQI